MNSRALLVYFGGVLVQVPFVENAFTPGRGRIDSGRHLMDDWHGGHKFGGICVFINGVRWGITAGKARITGLMDNGSDR